MLFATLDPTSRRVTLPSGQRIVVTDTVGFINKLPHDLVEAFRATLEEVLRADLLIEVVDASDPDFVGQQQAVQVVLDELGAGDKPRIVAFNKIDLLAPGLRAASMPAGERAVFVSAASGEGIDPLLERVAGAAARPDGGGRRGGALVPGGAGRTRQGRGGRRRAVHRRRGSPLRAPPRCDRGRGAARGSRCPAGRSQRTPIASLRRPMVEVTADAIRSAHARIPSAFRDSPQFISEPLSEEIGVPVVVKLETPNPIGSFKGRGTWLAVSELAAAGKVGEGRGVVVASAGNFGQGVAYAGRAMGIPVIVFAATTADSEQGRGHATPGRRCPDGGGGLRCGSPGGRGSRG